MDYDKAMQEAREAAVEVARGIIIASGGIPTASQEALVGYGFACGVQFSSDYQLSQLARTLEVYRGNSPRV